MDFVVGFMREALSNRIVMVRKAKPAWQTGLLNGVGGKVDHRVPLVPAAVAAMGERLTGKPAKALQGEETRLETPLEAMVREFKEETGIETKPQEWRLVLYMNDPRDFYTGKDGGTVYWFAATRRFLPKLPDRVLDSGEPIETVHLHSVGLMPDVLASPRWIIPMAFLDSTLVTLGADADVAANARAAATASRFDARGFLSKLVQERTDKIAAGVLAPDTRFSKPDGEIATFAPVGCKLKFAQRDGAPLCGCFDKCCGDGMSPANLEIALGRKVTDEKDGKLFGAVVVESSENDNPQNIRHGDAVVNMAKTEVGKVIGIVGDVAWVQSDKYPARRVTMYLRDLSHSGGKVGTIHGDSLVDLAKVSGPTIKRPITADTRLVPDRSRVGVVRVDGVSRHHNGRMLGDMASGPATPDMVNSRSIGQDGHDKVVPAEPAASPDAPWVKGKGERDIHIAVVSHPNVMVFDDPRATKEGDPEGGGAQEHFGAASVRKALPPMQEQREREGFYGGARSGELGFHG